MHSFTICSSHIASCITVGYLCYKPYIQSYVHHEIKDGVVNEGTSIFLNVAAIMEA